MIMNQNDIPKDTPVKYDFKKYIFGEDPENMEEIKDRFNALHINIEDMYDQVEQYALTLLSNAITESEAFNPDEN